MLELMLGFHPFDPQHVGNSATLIDNLMSGTYVHPDPSRDTRLVTFIENVLDPRPYMRLRTVDSLMAHLGIDRASC